MRPGDHFVSGTTPPSRHDLIRQVSGIKPPSGHTLQITETENSLRYNAPEQARQLILPWPVPLCSCLRYNAPEQAVPHRSLRRSRAYRPSLRYKAPEQALRRVILPQSASAAHPASLRMESFPVSGTKPPSRHFHNDKPCRHRTNSDCLRYKAPERALSEYISQLQQQQPIPEALASGPICPALLSRYLVDPPLAPRRRSRWPQRLRLKDS